MWAAGAAVPLGRVPYSSRLTGLSRNSRSSGWHSSHQSIVPSPGVTSVVAQAATAAAITSVSAPGSAVMNSSLEFVADVDDRRVEPDQELDQAPGRQRPVRLDLWTAVVGVADGLEPGCGEGRDLAGYVPLGAGGDGEGGQAQGSLAAIVYRLCEPRGSLCETRWPISPQVAVLIACTRRWSALASCAVGARSLVSRSSVATIRLVLAVSRGLVAAGEPLGERRVAQQHRGGLVAPDAAADGLAHRDEVVGHERRPVPVMVERPEPHRAPDDAEPQLPRLVAQLADGFGGLPGDRQRRAEQVPHGELARPGTAGTAGRRAAGGNGTGRSPRRGRRWSWS